ncbi:xylose ABC transporter [Bifidobacterium goeldii]|uniref:Xylose ABC transporter n=1 Tax=Bifidobacterium goeldii TaxID=2306975 RepID=A0A430FKL3_9BIFI|nr:substrate-binding domain-containing protein [Bifidobacterium goeldii]RSX53281.1 xylose ABC transporter [Bifidobacterium goeldii]
MSLRHMMCNIRRFAQRALTVTLAAGLSVTLAGCASNTPKPDATDNDDTTPTSLGTIAIFTPSDGITLSQHTPLNKWAKLVPDIEKALKAQGYDAKHISAATSDNLDEQSRDIQDFVVDHAVAASSQSSQSSQSSDSEKKSAASSSTSSDASDETPKQPVTLLVAPITSPDKSTRQYGDYVSNSTSTTTSSTSSDSADDSAGSSESASSDANNAASDATADTSASADAADAAATARLVSALELAHDSGMHVILMANSIDGFTPDAFVEFSTAKRIGQIQARNLAEKLQLSKTSKDNPKSIEVLLPYDAQDDDGNDLDPAFAREVFAGVWDVLGPYFQSGQAISPSGLLNAKTTAADWFNVAFEIDKDSQIKDELSARLRMSKDSDTRTRIDGIIAMNDYVASGVVEALSDLGYTGSAADVNPSISISGIVGNITGKHDLAKKKVPDPIKSSDSDSDSSTDESAADADKDSQWPIVTGYGAYVDEIPEIVNGHQWMTAIENRQTIAEHIAQACTALSQGKALTKLDFIQHVDVNGSQVPAIRDELLAVSASNLKSALIDPGYISLADAGL